MIASDTQIHPSQIMQFPIDTYVHDDALPVAQADLGSFRMDGPYKSSWVNIHPELKKVTKMPIPTKGIQDSSKVKNTPMNKDRDQNVRMIPTRYALPSNLQEKKGSSHHIRW